MNTGAKIALIVLSAGVATAAVIIVKKKLLTPSNVATTTSSKIAKKLTKAVNQQELPNKTIISKVEKEQNQSGSF